MNRALLAAVAAVLLSAVSVRAETRQTDVPNGFFNLYGGFSSVGNTNLKIQNTGYSYDVHNLNMKNNVWGGLGVGYWFLQYPVSLAGSLSMDFVPSAIKAQTADATYTSGGTSSSVKIAMADRSLFQFVTGLNAIAGVPLGFVRPYIGVGPALFIVDHTINFYDTNGNLSQSVSSMDAKLGYNAFLGAEAFISRRFSVFVEGKYSQVNNLDFQPYPSTAPAYHNKYDRIVTRRLAVGGTLHF